MNAMTKKQKVDLLLANLSQKIISALSAMHNVGDNPYHFHKSIAEHIIKASGYSDVPVSAIAQHVSSRLSILFKQNKVRRTPKRIGRDYGYWLPGSCAKPTQTTDDRMEQIKAVENEMARQSMAVNTIKELLPLLNMQQIIDLQFILTRRLEDDMLAMRSEISALQVLKSLD